MTPTLSSPSSFARRSARRDPRRAHAGRAEKRRARSARRAREVLGRYTDARGRAREVLAQAGLHGSVLVVDRAVSGRSDRRLVAHLPADEPAENAALVCAHYLPDASSGRCSCRPLAAEDSRIAPICEDWEESGPAPVAMPDLDPIDPDGRCYRLKALASGLSIPQLRWCEHLSPRPEGRPGALSVRELTARLDAYEPVRTLTARALAHHRGDATVSTTVLRAELERLLESPIVLNRRLRETTLAAIEREGLSLSEIAIRCGRVKRDCRGNESGETSWLARRLGILPEGGRDAPTPWVHSDVLALIARSGLGISPREVELE
jgi:hypothetical protein